MDYVKYMHTHLYLDLEDHTAIEDSDDDDEDKNPETRISMGSTDKRVIPEEEFSDSEDEGEAGRRNHESHQKKKFKAEDMTKEAEQGKLPNEHFYTTYFFENHV